MADHYYKYWLKEETKLGTAPQEGISGTTYLYTGFTGQKMPMHIRLGPNACGSPSEKKRFRNVEFHGRGSQSGELRVRVYIDDHYVCDGRVVLSEQPSKHRTIGIPIRRQVGYTIDIEFVGVSAPRLVEINYEMLED